MWRERPSQASATLRTALTPAVWGTTYLVATEFLPSGRPLLAATTRALPVGLVFLMIGRRLPSGSWWWRSAVLGVLNIGAFFALLFVAAFRLPGGVAATAGALQPLVAAALAAILVGEAFTRRTAVAGVAGVVGVAMLVLGPSAALDPIGVAAAVAGTISMATGVVLTKHWGRPVDLITFTGWQLTTGGVFLVPLLLLSEGLPTKISATNMAGFVWLGVAGTGLAYANWFQGIQQLPVSMVSFLGLLSPLVATVAGWWIVDEHLTVGQALGAVLVLIAVVAPHLRRSSTCSRSGRAVVADRIIPFCGRAPQSSEMPAHFDTHNHCARATSAAAPSHHRSGPHAVSRHPVLDSACWDSGVGWHPLTSAAHVLGHGTSTGLASSARVGRLDLDTISDESLATNVRLDRRSGAMRALETVEAVYSAFEQRDVGRLVELIHEDCVITQDPALPWGGRHVGRDGVLTFLASLAGTIDSAVKMEALFEAGDEVVQYGRTQGVVRTNGVAFDVPEVHRWTVVDGQVIAAHFAIDSAAMQRALDGAGEGAG